MDSGADATYVAIAQVGLAAIGEDGTELGIRVAKAVIVIGVGAFIRCAPVMFASLPRKTNNEKGKHTRRERSKIFSKVKLFTQGRTTELTKLCPISCPNE